MRVKSKIFVEKCLVSAMKTTRKCSKKKKIRNSRTKKKQSVKRASELRKKEIAKNEIGILHTRTTLR